MSTSGLLSRRGSIRITRDAIGSHSLLGPERRSTAAASVLQFPRRLLVPLEDDRRTLAARREDLAHAPVRQRPHRVRVAAAQADLVALQRLLLARHAHAV